MSVVVPISSLLLVICLASLFIPQLNLQSDPIFWITYYPIGTTLLDFSYFSFTLLDLSHFLMPDFVFYFVGNLGVLFGRICFSVARRQCTYSVLWDRRNISGTELHNIPSPLGET